MGSFNDKVAFITGVARGQGRSHALRLAQEGASVIGIDIAGPVSDHNAYRPADQNELDETSRLLEKHGRPFVVRTADVRDSQSIDSVLSSAVAEFGNRLDIVVANAGICNWNRFWEMPDDQWDTLIDVNLTGVWRTLKSAAPHMIAAGNGGSIITVSSVAGIKALPAQGHYTAAKHGVVGLTKAAAIELAEYNIRVNSIHPWGVETEMTRDSRMQEVLTAHPQYLGSYGSILTQLPIANVDDITDAVMWLASDQSRTVTGTQLTLDMGATKV